MSDLKAVVPNEPDRLSAYVNEIIKTESETSEVIDVIVRVLFGIEPLELDEVVTTPMFGVYNDLQKSFEMSQINLKRLYAIKERL